jgi:hypothetical protein
MKYSNVVFAAQEPMVRNQNGHWIRNPTFDLDDAKRFGSIRFVWAPGAASFSPADLRTRAVEIAEEFDDERDWIVNLGSPTLIATLAWAIGHVGKRLRVLEWDRRERAYVPTTDETE